MFSINCYGCFLPPSIVQIRVTTFENVAWIDFKDSHLDRIEFSIFFTNEQLTSNFKQYTFLSIILIHWNPTTFHPQSTLGKHSSIFFLKLFFFDSWNIRLLFNILSIYYIDILPWYSGSFKKTHIIFFPWFGSWIWIFVYIFVAISWFQIDYWKLWDDCFSDAPNFSRHFFFPGKTDDNEGGF